MLVNTWLGQVPVNDTNPIDSYVEMMNHPILAAGADLRILLGVSMMEPYTHPDPKIQAEGRASVSNLKGSFLNILAGMLTHIVFGRSWSEVAFDIKKRKAVLKAIQTLDPRYYRFEGGLGEINTVHYYGHSDIKIPYSSGIHLINQPYLALGGDPYGIAACKRAYPYWELFKVVMACVAIASERQANDLPVVKTDTSDNNVMMPDSEGRPMIDPQTGEPQLFNRGYVRAKQLEELKNNSFLVLDILDEIDSLSNKTDGKFYADILSFLESMMLLCFLVPRTTTNTGGNGTGDSNLNSGHREILRLVTRSQMLAVGEELVENVMRPMLTFNYGELDDYGSFPVSDEDGEDTIQLLQVIGNVVQSGGFSAADLQVVNRMRQLARIPVIAQEEFIPSEPVISNGDRNARLLEGFFLT